MNKKQAVGTAVNHFLAGAVVFFSGCQSEPKPEVAEVIVAKSESDSQTRDWKTPRGGVHLQGATADAVVTDPHILWRFEAGAGISASAAVADGEVYCVNDSGALIVLDLETGSELWRFQGEDEIEAEPVVAGGLVFIGSVEGVFSAIDRKTHQVVWQREFEDKLTAGPNVVTSPSGEGTWLLLSGYDGVLRCLRVTDGSEVWNYPTGNYINGTPALLNASQVIFGGCDSFLHVVNLADGNAVDSYETTGYVPASVAVYGEIGYCGNYANEVIAFETRDPAAEVWNYSPKNFPYFSSPAVTEKTVFIGSRDKRLHAIDRLSGKGLWTYRTGGRVDSSPLAFRDAVVFASDDGWLYAVQPDEGTELWKRELGGSFTASPVYAQGKIIIGSSDGILYALGEK